LKIDSLRSSKGYGKSVTVGWVCDLRKSGEFRLYLTARRSCYLDMAVVNGAPLIRTEP